MDGKKSINFGRSRMSKLISGNYGTHMGPLIKVMELTDGDVLELGVGYFSTPYLHYKCLLDKRHLVSYDNDKGWIRRFADSDFYNHFYRGEYHDFRYTQDWNIDLDKPWDVALVDLSPDEMRKETVKKLANLAKYIVIHDSNKELERNYHYSEIYPLFKYKRVWDKDPRHATILSNFFNLEDLW